MLIECPECGHRVSDRAAACPQCAFPVAEHVTEQAAEEQRAREAQSRTRAGDVDCPRCEARGFRTFDQTNDRGEARPAFTWCVACEHTGRVALVRSDAGYYAVVDRHVEAFLAGKLDVDETNDAKVHALGTETPAGHRYPQAGKRVPYDDR